MSFAYWAIDINTKEKVNFMDSRYHEIGGIVEIKGRYVMIEDLAVENRQQDIDDMVAELHLYP
jgi:hypothetical protein